MDARPERSFTLRVLGGFELRDADGRDFSPAGKKQRALIACLALSAGTAWSRERLTALLWGDRDEEQARGSLRQSLVELRRIGISALQSSRETVALDAGIVAVDAVEFARLAEAGELQRAAELYRGELLEGVIRDGIGAGEFPEQDARASAACLVGAFMEGLVGPLAPESIDHSDTRALVEAIAVFCLQAVAGRPVPARVFPAAEVSA